ncbi:MAG: TatD family hydrolase [Ardenticatenaceae bacterium]|nr:TatD family hydrolase [Ardenticatenaceae bacterium]
MDLIDTHCHLDMPQFDGDRTAVIQRAAAASVSQIVVPAIDLENITAVTDLAQQHDGVFAAVGIHPNSCANWTGDWLTAVRTAAARPKVVAIGEIGLDYYWDDAPHDVQHEALAQQLELAAELNLPVIIHNRDSSADVVRLLAASPLAGRENPGVLHSFSGDWTMAQAALEMGFYLGFTGPVTFKKADDLRDIVRRTPLDRLLVETDAPYLTPQPYRGKRNQPAYVTYVAERIAAERGVETAVIAQHTTANARRLFRLPAAA